MKERLLLFLKHKNIKPSNFEKTVKLSNGFVNSIGSNVRETTIQKIKEKFPDLNEKWWKTGDGNMLIDESKVDFEKVFFEKEEITKIINISEGLLDRLKDSQNQLSNSQKQLSESQKQISTLLEIIKSR